MRIPSWLPSCILLSTVGLSACGGATFDPAPRSRDPVLEKLEPPPLNLPRHTAARPQGPPDPARMPALPPGDRPAIVVRTTELLDAKTLASPGLVTSKKGEIEFAPENRAGIRIYFRLPRELPSPPELSHTGTLALVDRTGPAGPVRQVIVSVDGMPLIGEVRLKSPTPINFALAPGLELRQQRRPDRGSGDVAVEIGGETRKPQLLTTRGVTEVATAGGVLLVFVGASYVVDLPDPTGQYPDGYILHAWVVRPGT